MLGLAFAILNSWTALSASLSLALPAGGPTSVIWGLVTAGICNLCLAAGLAEMLSAYPTGNDYCRMGQSFPDLSHRSRRPVSFRCHDRMEAQCASIVLDHRLDQRRWLDCIGRVRRAAGQPIDRRRHIFDA